MVGGGLGEDLEVDGGLAVLEDVYGVLVAEAAQGLPVHTANK